MPSVELDNNLTTVYNYLVDNYMHGRPIIFLLKVLRMNIVRGYCYMAQADCSPYGMPVSSYAKCDC